MHHLFIVNPAAGKGRAIKMTDRIHSCFRDSGLSYEIKVTEAPGHAREIAGEAIAAHEALRLYSVGGDGTLNEVVNGMAGSKAELGIIPCGSGNDAVRSFYHTFEPEKLIEILPSSSSAMFDVGKINDKYFLNIASIGFDAEVALKSSAFKKLPLVSGSMAYILSILYTLIVLKKYKLNFAIGSPADELRLNQREVLMAVFANGSFYGGGMKPAPRAKMNDGILDFCVVKPVNRLQILKFFPLFKKGQHESMEYVEVTRGTKALFESTIPFPLNIDGEVSLQTRASVEIIPDSIRIILPNQE